ncbi:MAG TPA: PQQ-dependent catabolism-associated CXXCW motif protein [Xanthobacteraceae bacterium]|jgi:PQQ-dependent catabolism-associated CXXCW motif protein
MGRRGFRVIVLGALALASGGAAAQTPSSTDEPQGYRTENYRAPTPATLRGARVVSTIEAQAIWREASAAFIDVLPQFPPAPNLPAGTVWQGQRRYDIPGSTWLPDTGYGELSPAAEAYLKTGLERITGGDYAKQLVMYCQRNCWMSWNAAKRAVMWGYTAVIWYPEGTDGWQDAGLPLEEAKPAPHPGE